MEGGSGEAQPAQDLHTEFQGSGYLESDLEGRWLSVGSIDSLLSEEAQRRALNWGARRTQSRDSGDEHGSLSSPSVFCSLLSNQPMSDDFPF